MNQPAPRYPSTASGQSFEEWKLSPVYRTQVKTFALARRLCGHGTKEGQGHCSLLGADDASGLNQFRCLPVFRTAAALQLRSAVAKQLWVDRKAERATPALTAGQVAFILNAAGEACREHRVGFYPSLAVLAQQIRSSKHWRMGETFVFAPEPERYLIALQVAPASCEMAI